MSAEEPRTRAAKNNVRSMNSMRGYYAIELSIHNHFCISEIPSELDAPGDDMASGSEAVGEDLRTARAFIAVIDVIARRLHAYALRQ